MRIAILTMFNGLSNTYSLVNVVAEHIKMFLDNNIDTTLNVVNIRGLNYLNVHGDYDNFTSCQKVIEMLDIPIYCVHMGHLHHNKTDWMQKYKLIMSGSIQGMDDFCIQKRIFGKAQQLVCVCNEKGIQCTYDIDLQGD